MAFLCSPATGTRSVKVLVAEARFGKTTLLQAAISQLSAEARTTYLVCQDFGGLDFLAYLLREMGSQADPSDLLGAKQELANLVGSSRFVIAIDDAHRLTPGALEDLGSLFDEDNRDGHVSLLLAGLPELQYRLAEPRAKKVRERISGVMTLETPIGRQILPQPIDREPVSPATKLSILRSTRPAGTPFAISPEESGGVAQSTSTPAREEAEASAPAPILNGVASGESAAVLPDSTTPEHRSSWRRISRPALVFAVLSLLLLITWVVFRFAGSSAGGARTAAQSSGPVGVAPAPASGHPPPLESSDPTPANSAAASSTNSVSAGESLRAAAEGGNAEAQYNLGLQLASSQNVSDLISAYAWIVMARSAGHEVNGARLHEIAQKLKSRDLLEVRYKLGSMYEKGVGCRPDPVNADIWYLLAASSGDTRSASASTRLESQMTTPQIAEAHKRAAEWTRAHTQVHP